MSFKSITEDDIKFCEQEIRKIGASIERQLDDSADMNCERNEDYLVKTFGKTFSENPSEFHFLRGEVSFIKQLVDHVKRTVDGNGANTGLDRFKYKEKRARKANRKQRAQFDAQHDAPNMKTNDEPKAEKNNMSHTVYELNQLKANLFGRIKMCFNTYQASVGVELFDESMVDVQIENNKIIGKVNCVICKKNKPKKVYYDDVVGRWVTTNFKKHLQTSHPDCKQQILDDEISNNNHSTESDQISFVDSTAKKSKEGNEADLVCMRKIVVKIEKTDNWLYHQIATQINEMVQAVLTNGDEEGTMEFQLENNKICRLSVAKISGDGNCLFAAIVHQLWKYPVNSAQHIEAVKQLRSKVVEYILGNFESFEFILKDRVYDLKEASEISDISAECKSYVQFVLSRNGEYGGFETIKALSELYKVNILTFLEDSSCAFHNKEKIHEKTIAIAYRFWNKDGQRTRNHYDSVYDMNPEYILAASESVVSKQME